MTLSPELAGNAPADMVEVWEQVSALMGRFEADVMVRPDARESNIHDLDDFPASSALFHASSQANLFGKVGVHRGHPA